MTRKIYNNIISTAVYKVNLKIIIYDIFLFIKF